MAQWSLTAAYSGSANFPTIVRTLRESGFEGYLVDYRTARATYFLEDGRDVTVAMPSRHGHVAAEFKADLIAQAVREAQTGAPDYSYAGFSTKVVGAGCAGYMVSFPGRRVVYFGRTAETHVEHFPT
jgi:uncharacterized protein YbcV (DUF1398 family)